MDAQLIEKLDRRRHNRLLWQTVLFGLAYPVPILNHLLPDGKTSWSPLFIAGFIAGTIGLVVFIAMVVVDLVELRAITKDPELKALNDELYVLYGYKSTSWSFMATLITSVVLLVLGDVLAARWANPITTNLACNIIIYVAIMTSRIAKLIYMRR